MSINDENPFDKFQHLFMIKKQQKKKSLSKIGIQCNFLTLISDVYKIPTAKMLLNGEKF